MPTDINAEDALVVAEVNDRFRVRDEASASWVVRKVNEERAHRARVQTWYEAEMRRSERRERFLLQRFGAELIEWARQYVARQFPKRRSIHLPAGVIGFRTEPARIVVADEPKLLEWCRRHLPSAVKVVEHVLKREIDNCIKASGEVPPGAELAGGGEKFFIK